MRYRPHYASYDDSIARMVTLRDPTLAELIKAIQRAYKPLQMLIPEEDIAISYMIYDDRPPWNANCYIVHVPAAKVLSWDWKGSPGVLGVMGYVDDYPEDYGSY